MLSGKLDHHVKNAKNEKGGEVLSKICRVIGDIGYKPTQPLDFKAILEVHDLRPSNWR
jgi:hypothetical protein